MSAHRIDAKVVVPAFPERQLPAGANEMGSDGRAWQREMERAQMLAWLSHGAIGHAAASSGGMMSSATSAAAPVAGSAPAPGAAPAAYAQPAALALAASRPEHAAKRAAVVGGAPVREATGGVTRGQEIARRSPERASGAASSVPMPRGNSSPQSAGEPGGVLPDRVALGDAAALEPTTSCAQRPAGEPQVLSSGANGQRSHWVRLDTEQIVAVLREFGPADVAMSVGMAAEHAGFQNAGPVGMWAASPALGIAAGTTAEPQAWQTLGSATVGNPQPPGSGGRGPQAVQVTERSQRAAEPRAVTGSPAEPIRVHADWSKEGVRLYLGMDAAALGSLQAITVQLQAWLSAQGIRLRSISCNGQVIVQEASSRADSFESELLPPGPRSFPLPRFTRKESP